MRLASRLWYCYKEFHHQESLAPTQEHLIESKDAESAKIIFLRWLGYKEPMEGYSQYLLDEVRVRKVWIIEEGDVASEIERRMA